MPVTYQQESLVTSYKEAENLIYSEWDEVSHLKDLFPLEVDWDMYFQMEDLGLLKIFTARDNDKLVGYFSVVVAPDLHSRGKLRATNTAIFLHKDYRKGFVGIKLFKFVEQCLVEDGLPQLQIVHTDKNDISPLLKRLGYEKVETKYEKRLRD